MKLTEEQWSILKPLIPTPKIRKDGRGRPWRGNREVLEGILWVLRNGCSWSSLPAEYPPYQTCHRRFQQWQKQGVWDKLLKSIARQMERDGSLDLTESFMDGSFSAAKKVATRSAKPRRARVRRLWPSQMVKVFQYQSM
jgi:transposase